MLVNRVYDMPESGLCAKCFIMWGLNLGTCHAAQTKVFTAPIAQHARLPSPASRMGWKTWMYDQMAKLRTVWDHPSDVSFKLDRPAWSACQSVSLGP